MCLLWFCLEVKKFHINETSLLLLLDFFLIIFNRILTKFIKNSFLTSLSMGRKVVFFVERLFTLITSVYLLFIYIMSFFVPKKTWVVLEYFTACSASERFLFMFRVYMIFQTSNTSENRITVSTKDLKHREFRISKTTQIQIMTNLWLKNTLVIVKLFHLHEWLPTWLTERFRCFHSDQLRFGVKKP